MSNGAKRTPAALPEWDRLELSARRLLQEHARVRERAERAEARAAELERTVRELSDGGIDPLDLQQRLAAAERENAELRARLEQAGRRLERMLTQIQFLQDAGEAS